MCTVTRTTAEPPCHLECATFSAQACPFLTRPAIVRREGGLPEQSEKPAGIMIERNPGVTALWTVKHWKYFLHKGGILFQVGEPQNRILTKDDLEAKMLIELSKYEGSYGEKTIVEHLIDGKPFCGRIISLTIEPEEGN